MSSAEGTLWSRRFTQGDRVCRVVVSQHEVVIEQNVTERLETLGAGWSFVRAAQAIVALMREGWDAADESDPTHRFHPSLPLTWDPAHVSHPEVEARLGALLVSLPYGERQTLEALSLAAPLVLLQWPVGFRFGELFEVHDQPSSQGLLADIAREIASRPGQKMPLELARIAMLQKNPGALGPLLTLVERGAPFDGWMDVIDLAADVGEAEHAPILKRLAKGRVAADVRQSLLAVARELA